MPNLGRLCAALAVPLVLWAAAAEAQTGHRALVAPVEADPGIAPLQSGSPDLRMTRGDLRLFGQPPPGGLIATLPVVDNLQFGVGRFAVLELAGPRTNLEPERRPADMRRRDRGIMAVGLSFRF